MDQLINAQGPDVKCNGFLMLDGPLEQGIGGTGFNLMLAWVVAQLVEPLSN